MVINFNVAQTPLMGIYCIENLNNHKKYIGSSINVIKRLYKHRAVLRKNIHENAYFQNSWNKHKEENFICYILEAFDTDIRMYLAHSEQKWIDLLNPEYNLIKQVERIEISTESREKMSQTRLKLFKEGKLKPYQFKKIKKYDLDGIFLQEYPSLQEAALSENVHVNTVLRSAKKYAAQGSGFIWRYSDDTDLVKPLVQHTKRTRWDNARLNMAL